MMKKVLLFFSVLALSLLTACNPSKAAKDDLESFTNRMEAKSASWSEADWDDAAQHYDEITETLKRYEYTDEELHYIGKLEGRCTAMFMAHYFSTIEDRTNDALQELDGALEGFFETIDQ